MKNTGSRVYKSVKRQIASKTAFGSQYLTRGFFSSRRNGRALTISLVLGIWLSPPIIYSPSFVSGVNQLLCLCRTLPHHLLAVTTTTTGNRRLIKSMSIIFIGRTFCGFKCLIMRRSPLVNVITLSIYEQYNILLPCRHNS